MTNMDKEREIQIENAEESESEQSAVSEETLTQSMEEERGLVEKDKEEPTSEIKKASVSEDVDSENHSENEEVRINSEEKLKELKAFFGRERRVSVSVLDENEVDCLHEWLRLRKAYKYDLLEKGEFVEARMEFSEKYGELLDSSERLVNLTTEVSKKTEPSRGISRARRY